MEAMILAYVPDAEYYSYEDALSIALKRDADAALNLLATILEEE